MVIYHGYVSLPEGMTVDSGKPPVFGSMDDKNPWHSIPWIPSWVIHRYAGYAVWSSIPPKKTGKSFKMGEEHVNMD